MFYNVSSKFEFKMALPRGDGSVGKSLLYEHEDLSLYPRHPHKKPGVTLAVWCGRLVEPWSSLASQPS